MESLVCPPISGRVGIDLPLVEELRLTYPPIEGELNWPPIGGRIENDLLLVE
jgi:hypothetical protein